MSTTHVSKKLPRSVKQITFLKTGPAGVSVTVVKRRRRRQSKGLVRIWERIVRYGAEARAVAAEDYLDRHQRANQKKRDGWLRKYGVNLARSARKGQKVFKIRKIFK